MRCHAAVAPSPAPRRAALRSCAGLLAGGLLAALLLAGCATPPGGATRADVLLLGEQHDAAAHQRTHREAVERLAARGRLAAVAIEMADQGASTAGLPPGAGDAEVRAALRWNEAAWPWESYGPAIMAAVRAGVPVLGANLPRERMRAAMGDATLDAAVPPAVLQAQRSAVREGHCKLLPEHQIGPMTRVQIARDRSMAQVVAAAAIPGKTVLLLAGSGHVDPALGVPLHLPAALSHEPVLLPREATGKDYCAQLRQMHPPQRGS